MPRYIKASDAEQRIVALYRKERSAYADVFNTAIDACQTIVLDMFDNEAIDVPERNVGKWIDINYDGTLYECSVCHDLSCCNGNFCSNCGADMRGGDDAEIH